MMGLFIPARIFAMARRLSFEEVPLFWAMLDRLFILGQLDEEDIEALPTAVAIILDEMMKYINNREEQQ